MVYQVCTESRNMRYPPSSPPTSPNSINTPFVVTNDVDSVTSLKQAYGEVIRLLFHFTVLTDSSYIFEIHSDSVSIRSYHPNWVHERDVGELLLFKSFQHKATKVQEHMSEILNSPDLVSFYGNPFTDKIRTSAIRNKKYLRHKMEEIRKLF